MLFGGGLSSSKHSVAIRHGGYFELIINTDLPSSDLSCSIEVIHWETGARKIRPLQSKILLHVGISCASVLKCN